MKVLSIIIVSYNEVDYLRAAIDSCINQNIRNDYEIIIGDDGSSDGSIPVIEDYAKRYPNLIRYYVMKRDANQAVIPSVRVSNLLKTGLSLSNGQFIMMMSADDIIIGKKRIQEQIEFLEKNKNYCACYTDFIMFWPDGRKRKVITKSSLKRGPFWGDHYVHISCFVFKREVLLNILDTFCDDTGMIFSILKTGRIAHIDGIGFGYRQRDASIMHQADKLELSICELLLYQDVLNAGGLRTSSMARFFEYISYARRHRDEITRKKYDKYIKLADKNKNNIIGLIMSSRDNLADTIYLDLWIAFSFCFKVWYMIRKKFEFLFKCQG